MIFYILFVCCFPHRHCGGTASPLRSLYTITEKGGEHEKRADGKEAGADKHHDGLAYVVVTPVHLDVNLERGYDNQNRGERVAHVLDIQHHRDHEVVHRGQRVRTPAVIHAAAFGKCRTWEDGT